MINFILKSWENRKTNIVVKRIVVLTQTEKTIVITSPTDYEFEIYDWDLIELSLMDSKIEYMIKDNTLLIQTEKNIVIKRIAELWFRNIRLASDRIIDDRFENRILNDKV